MCEHTCTVCERAMHEGVRREGWSVHERTCSVSARRALLPGHRLVTKGGMEEGCRGQSLRVAYPLDIGDFRVDHAELTFMRTL